MAYCSLLVRLGCSVFLILRLKGIVHPKKGNTVMIYSALCLMEDRVRFSCPQYCWSFTGKRCYTVSSCLSYLVQLLELQTVCAHTWTRLPSQELQATVNSEAKTMASVGFFKTMLHVKTLGLLWTNGMEAFMVLLHISFRLNSSHYSFQLFDRFLQRIFPLVD